MWDVGVIPDTAFKRRRSAGHGGRVNREPGRLLPQLAALGYTPADITYLAMSHYHSDHTANANAFAGSTWLVRAAERDAMFAEKPAGIIQQATFSALKTARRRFSTKRTTTSSATAPSSSSPRPGTRPAIRCCF